ncbi:MAG: hypothetical protein QOF76_2455, partial [Solirubrobacteraceae bacterium]|nr:hypothetical protein [Solirubrobacteraceae bacterium]
ARLLGWRCVYEPQATGRHVRTYSPTTRNAVAEQHRRLQFRNRYLMCVKNDTWAGVLRAAPLLIAWELLALGHVLLRERHLLGAYRDAWRGLPEARRRRRLVQAARRARAPFGLQPPG